MRNDVRFFHSEDFVYRAAGGIDHEGEIYHGLPAFREAWAEVCRHVYGYNMMPPAIGDVYTEWVHKRFESNLGPYFRIVYTILQRIKNDGVLSREEKIKFGNLLRSQLTSDELVLHGLNGLSSVSKDFGELITEFRLLKYLPDDYRRELMIKCYPAQAFEGRGD